MKLRKKTRRALLIVLAILLLAGGYWGVMFALDRNPLLNFDVVEPGRLLRSGQPRIGDLERIRAEHGLGTIFCLRGFETHEVKQWAIDNNVKLVSLSMKADVPPTEDQVGLFFDVVSGHTVDIPHYRDTLHQWHWGYGRKRPVRFDLPVLVHCIGGSDRTGVMVAMYRMALHGWDLDRAKRDMMFHFHISPAHPAMWEYLDRVGPTVTPSFGSRTDLDNLTVNPRKRKPRTESPPDAGQDSPAPPPADPPLEREPPAAVPPEAALVPPPGG